MGDTVTDEHIDDLPQKLGALIKAHPGYQRLVELGPPDPDPAPKCARCHDLGFLRRDAQPGQDGFGVPIMCECRKPATRQARVAKLWSNAQAPAAYAAFTLETYPGDAAVVETLRGWLPTDQSLVLGGEYGAGKTGLSVALLRALAEQSHSVLFVNTPSMLRRVRATYGDKDGDSESDVIDSLAEVDVLALDDVGKERLTPWATELLYDVVNRRYSAARRTIVTTNLAAEALAAHVGQATFWRIFERSLWVTVSGNLRRARRVARG